MKDSGARRHVPSLAPSSEPTLPSLPPVPLLAPSLPVLGRDEELATLEARRRAIAGGGAELVVLTGEPGVGKSALAGAFAERSRRAGHTVLEARCEPHRAYAPFASLTLQALDRLHAAGRRPPPETRWLACAEGCCRFWFEHQTHGEDAAPGQERASAAARERRNRFFAAIQRLLGALGAEGPPVLILHELQDADEATRELLAFLLDESRASGRAIGPEWSLSALFVATSTQSGDLGALQDAERVVPMPVEGLDVQGVAALLGSPELAAWVHARTGGAPERVLELLAAAPPEPGALVMSALEGLTPEARGLLEAVAVVERPMPLGWFEELLDGSVAQATVESLVRLELLERTRAPRRGRLALARPTMRERILASMEPARRRQLHLRCAARFADGSGPAALHALAAGNAERAAELALKEARALHARHAASEGAALLERVLDAGTSRDLEVRDALADLYGAMAQYGDALPHARAAAEASPEDLGATLRLGRLLAQAGQRGEAMTTVRAAHALATAAGDVDVRIAAEAELAELHHLAGQAQDARRWADLAIKGASARSLATHELAVRNTLGKIAYAQGDLRAARAIFARATQRALQAELPYRAMQGRMNEAVALVALGELQAAEPLLALAVEQAEEVEAADGRAFGLHNLALLAHLRRDYRDALHLYRRAAAETRVVGNDGLLAQVSANLGELFLTVGDHDRARQMLAFARQHAGPDLSEHYRRSLDLLDARIERTRGSLERAEAALARSAADESFELQVERANLALAAGRTGDAAEAAAGLPEATLPKERADRAVLEARV
ncbi:MAG: AAA family ATPase, partial [Myxococcota bacterium]